MSEVRIYKVSLQREIIQCAAVDVVAESEDAAIKEAERRAFANQVRWSKLSWDGTLDDTCILSSRIFKARPLSQEPTP